MRFDTARPDAGRTVGPDIPHLAPAPPVLARSPPLCVPYVVCSESEAQDVWYLYWTRAFVANLDLHLHGALPAAIMCAVWPRALEPRNALSQTVIPRSAASLLLRQRTG